MTQKEPSLPDTGNRVEFEGGALRDIYPGKPRYDLIPGVALKRLAQHYANGAAKYSDRNWEKGLPLSSFTNSMFSHIVALISGDHKEDHLAAIMWNAAGYIWTVDAVLRGQRPASLLDVPWLTPEEDSYLAAGLKDLASVLPTVSAVIGADEAKEQAEKLASDRVPGHTGPIAEADVFVKPKSPWTGRSLLDI